MNKQLLRTPKVCGRTLALASLFLFLANNAFAQGVLAGTITNDTSHEKLVGVQIQIMGIKETVTTDIEGTYQLELKPGKYQLAIAAFGYQKRRIKNIEINEGEITYCNVPLKTMKIESENDKEKPNYLFKEISSD